MNRGIRGMEVGMASLTITTHDPLGEFLLPVPAALGFAGLEVLVPKWGTFLPKDTPGSISELHFGFLMPRNK